MNQKLFLCLSFLLIFSNSYAGVDFADIDKDKQEALIEKMAQSAEQLKKITAAQTKEKAPVQNKKQTPVQKPSYTQEQTKKQENIEPSSAPVLFYMTIEGDEARLVSSEEEQSFPKKKLETQIDNTTIQKKNEQPSVEKKIIKKILTRDEYKKLNLDERYYDAYDHIFNTANSLTDNSYVLNEINSYFQKYVDSMSGDENLNIFFLVDSSMNNEMFLRFSREIDKIRKYNKKITGRIITNGLVITKEDRYEVQSKITKKQRELREAKNNDLNTSTIEKEIKKLQYIAEGNFDTHYKWAQKLYSAGVRGVKLQFNPTIFQDMRLDKVPAYVLSRCPHDYRYQDCRHIAIVRGNISLRSFFEMLAEDKIEYRGYYEALLE